MQSFIRIVGAELRLLSSVFFEVLGICIVLGTLLTFIGVLLHQLIWVESVSGFAILIVKLLLALGGGWILGFCLGIFAGGMRVVWLMVGLWALVPVILIPLSTVLSFNFFADNIMEAVRSYLSGVEAVVLEGIKPVEGEPEETGVAAIAIGIPLILISLVVAQFIPENIWFLFLVFMNISLALFLGLVPSGGLSLLLLFRAYYVRLKRRAGE